MGERAARWAMWTAGTGLWNILVNRVVPARWYVPSNVVVAALTALAAPRTRTRTDLRWALLGAGAGVAGVMVAERLPATSGLFDDARVDPDRMAWETLVRIPFGTVVLEETLFRHALPRVTDEPTAALLFGLWHVLPTLTALDINEVHDATARTRAVVAGVAATAAAALPLSWLRRKGGLLSPMLTHWAVNATAYALATRRLAAHH